MHGISFLYSLTSLSSLGTTSFLFHFLPRFQSQEFPVYSCLSTLWQVSVRILATLTCSCSERQLNSRSDLVSSHSLRRLLSYAQPHFLHPWQSIYWTLSQSLKATEQSRNHFSCHSCSAADSALPCFSLPNSTAGTLGAIGWQNPHLQHGLSLFSLAHPVGGTALPVLKCTPPPHPPCFALALLSPQLTPHHSVGLWIRMLLLTQRSPLFLLKYKCQDPLPLGKPQGGDWHLLAYVSPSWPNGPTCDTC